MSSRSLAWMACLLYLWIIPSFSSALEVTPGSPCASVCQDEGISGTNSSDIVCNDTDFFSTTTGSKFKSCVECLQTSSAVNGTENDLAWYLYNLRYTVDVCLFEYPAKIQNSSSPCATDMACNPLQSALETGNVSPNNGTEFQYCTADGGAFAGQTLASCVQCLQSTPNNVYLSNFLIALEAGCEQQPAPGAVLGLTGGLFSQTPLNITNPSSNQTASDTSGGSSTALPERVIIGISAGIGSLFLISTVLFCVYWRRQRRYDSEDRFDAMHVGLYSNPRRSWSATTNPVPSEATDYKHQGSSASGSEFPEPTGDFSTNADYYKQAAKVAAPVPQLMYGMEYSGGGAMPAHPAYIPHIVARTKSATPQSKLSQHSTTPEPKREASRPRDGSDSDAPRPRRKKSPPPQVYVPAEPSRAYRQAEDVSSVEQSDTDVERRRAANAQASQPAAAAAAPPPPPAGPPPPRIPSLVMPAPHRIRASKKYAPPTYSADAPNPHARSASAMSNRAPSALAPAPPQGTRKRDSSGSISGGDVRAFRDRERNRERSSSARRREDEAQHPGSNPADKVVEQRVDRRRWEELPIGSGKSLLYG